uniref:Uncharacterized protein n=1 Tax=Nothobranchius kadleci TaxID=1051664 RepID=A0A1A8BBM4_NOTKA
MKQGRAGNGWLEMFTTPQPIRGEGAVVIDCGINYVPGSADQYVYQSLDKRYTCDL